MNQEYVQRLQSSWTNDRDGKERKVIPTMNSKLAAIHGSMKLKALKVSENYSANTQGSLNS